MTFDLSIIIPTVNRAELLERNLQSLIAGVRCSFEIVVVDGASEDSTPAVLDRAKGILGDRLKIIREEQREGFVRAANKGFRAAGGRNMTWLNDDARALPGALDEAVRQIDTAGQDVGFLAMFHRFGGERNIAYEARRQNQIYRLCHIRGTLYANFPMGKRETYERLGYFDERFFLYAADPDLSLKAWHAGLKIVPAFGVFIEHDEHVDERRAEDSSRGRDDNAKLFAKWDLPPKNLERNDFDSTRHCTLRGLLEEAPPTVTFLISTYNRREALLATLKQLPTHDAETIIVDNASTDGTSEAVLRDFPGVCVLRLTNNRGACAKNAGLRLARGEYVVFLDDDSYPTGDSVRRMIGHFKLNPKLGAAVFDVILPDGSHECSAYPRVFIGCGTGFRREALIAAGGLPEDFFMQAEEYDLSLRLMDAGWDIQRFDDLRVNHLKTPGARQPTRATRLDVRNNLTLIGRYFPREWRWPFAVDWVKRYWWIAGSKGWRHKIAFARGLCEGIWRFPRLSERKTVSAETWERFAMMQEIARKMRAMADGQNVRTVLLIDAGKNLLPYFLAARQCTIEIVAIADSKLAGIGRSYRGIPVVSDDDARAMSFDAAIISNVSPVQAALRKQQWRKKETRPVIDLFEAKAPGALLPLPPGEGWGEGERKVA
jgi:GT2 family glycosyltransferase